MRRVVSALSSFDGIGITWYHRILVPKSPEFPWSSPSQKNSGATLETQHDAPLSVVDPQTNTAYVLIRADLFERARSLMEYPQPSSTFQPRAPIAPMMLRSQQAFWRDLPDLLKLKSNKHQWAAYHADERIGVGKTQTELYQECLRRGLQRGEFYVGKIEEDDVPPCGTLAADSSPRECSEAAEAVQQ